MRDFRREGLKEISSDTLIILSIPLEENEELYRKMIDFNTCHASENREMGVKATLC